MSDSDGTSRRQTLQETLDDRHYVDYEVYCNMLEQREVAKEIAERMMRELQEARDAFRTQLAELAIKNEQLIAINVHHVELLALLREKCALQEERLQYVTDHDQTEEVGS